MFYIFLHRITSSCGCFECVRYSWLKQENTISKKTLLRPVMNKMDWKKINKRSRAHKRGFSMIEIIIVIGILAIMVGVGATSFINQANRNRLNSASRMIATTIQQARQMAIAMRQERRVVIDAGALDGFTDSTISGVRVSPIRVWIEGKRCEQLNFDTPAICADRSGDLGNAVELTDPELIPDGIMLGLDGVIPGIDNPTTFYIEFSPRGSVSKVYFSGQEAGTLPNQIEPLIYVTRDNEIFNFRNETANYQKVVNDDKLPTWQPREIYKDNDDVEVREDFERYKINTIEVIRLTGRTRTYDYAVLGPFPLDHPEEATEKIDNPDKT